MDAHLHKTLSGETTPIFLATLDAEGNPNCVPVLSISPYEDDTLIFGEFMMNKSRRNLLGNDKVGIAVFSDTFEAWSLKGTFLGFETQGGRLDHVNRLPMLRYNAYTGVRAAGLIRVEEVSEISRLGKAGLLLNYLRARAAGVLLKPRRGNGRCMPRQVEEKFRRVSAVRAVAFRDGDGYPRAVPLMGCVPAGPKRLLLADPLFAPYFPDVAEGAEVAVAVLTRDPVAYQAKGKYRGTRAGVGVIDLNSCYSASPPLLGDRLDMGRS